MERVEIGGERDGVREVGRIERKREGDRMRGGWRERGKEGRKRTLL
jgi:hypothetical protein